MKTKRRPAVWVTSALVLQVRNLAIDVAARRVLSDASFTVAAGDKVGLVGRNGAGKTSLLKVLAGEHDSEAGLVMRRGTLGYVPQNPRPRAEAVSTALVHMLSGRERRRVELARVLFADADLVLLDEPTNHLDSDAKAWLMGFLRDYRGAVIVVSHDLVLLDAAISRVLHLDAGRLVEYRGTYTQYQQARALEEKRLTSLAGRQEAEIKRLSLLAEVMRRQTAKRARTAKSIFKRVDRLKAAHVSAPRRERKVKVHFPDPPHGGRVALTVDKLAKAYGGPLVFR